MAFRRMVIVDTLRGPVEVDVASDADASAIGTHHSAIGHYLETGDDSRLAALAGTRLRVGDDTYELETDLGGIEDLALAGDLGYDDIYVLK
jgi:hypothetical protein